MTKIVGIIIKMGLSIMQKLHFSGPNPPYAIQNIGRRPSMEDLKVLQIGLIFKVELLRAEKCIIFLQCS